MKANATTVTLMMLLLPPLSTHEPVVLPGDDENVPSTQGRSEFLCRSPRLTVNVISYHGRRGGQKDVNGACDGVKKLR